MQTDASPCSGHVRLSNTREGIPPVRQTSAGHAFRHVGQREVVRLSNSSAIRSGGIAGGELMQIDFISGREATETTQHDANDRHHRAEKDTIADPLTNRFANSHTQDDAAQNTGNQPGT